MSAAVLAPVRIGGAPPPIRRDRVTQLWAGAATVSWFGDCVFDIALAWTAVRVLPAGWAGLVVGISMLPQGLLMLLGGVLADRHDTRTIMRLGEAARIAVLVVAFALWSSGLHSGVVLGAIGLCFGVVAGLSNPARATLLRQLVHPDDLHVATGWTQIGNRLASLAGAPVGALVVAAFGLGAAMAIDALTFGCVLLVLLVVIRPRFRLTRDASRTVRTSLSECGRYLRRDRRTRVLLFALIAPNVFVGPATELGLPLRISTAGWHTVWLGIAEACCGCGAIAGSVLAMRLRGAHVVRNAFWMLALQGVGIMLVGLPHRAVVVGGMVLIGLTSGFASVWISTVFQQVVEPDYLGRVSSLSQLGDLLLLPVVTPLFGVLAARTSVAVTALVFGVGMAAVSTGYARGRELRQL